MTTVVFFLWLITASYAANLGTFPTPDACVAVGEKVEKDLADKAGPTGHVVCVMSLGAVNPPSAPTAEAKPPTKPEPGNLPDAPALLEHGLRLISQ